MDLGCGTGVIAAALARARPMLNHGVLATDQSAAAVASAAATAAANELTARVQVLRDDSNVDAAGHKRGPDREQPTVPLGTSVHARPP